MPLALLAPVPLKIAIDSAIGDHPLPWPLTAIGAPPGPQAALLIAVALVLGIALLTEAQKYLTWMLQAYTGERLALEFRAACSGTCSACRSPITTRAAPPTRSTASSTMRPPSSGSRPTAFLRSSRRA